MMLLTFLFNTLPDKLFCTLNISATVKAFQIRFFLSCDRPCAHTYSLQKVLSHIYIKSLFQDLMNFKNTKTTNFFEQT